MNMCENARNELTKVSSSCTGKLRKVKLKGNIKNIVRVLKEDNCSTFKNKGYWLSLSQIGSFSLSFGGSFGGCSYFFLPLSGLPFWQVGTQSFTFLSMVQMSFYFFL